MIKSCELLEYLTRSHKSGSSVLEIDPNALRKMVNRECSSIHVELRQDSSQTSLSSADTENPAPPRKVFDGVKIYAPEYSLQFEQYQHLKQFFVAMATHFNVNRAKSEDVKEAIRRFKQVTRKPVKAGLNYDCFDHYYHLTSNLKSVKSVQKTGKPSYIEKVRGKNLKSEPELTRQIRSYLDFTFMPHESEQVVCNLGYILKQLIIQIMSQKSEKLSLSSLYFKKVNIYIQQVSAQNQMQREKLKKTFKPDSSPSR